MKIGLFGGTFDPVHRGHIAPVQEARRRLGLDRVYYLPTARPPHKPHRRFAPPHARYAMVELALLHEEGLFASPHELTLDKPAYTVDTLDHFRTLYPEAGLYLVLGADAFVEIHQWYRWRDILAVAELVVLARPGWDLERMAQDKPGSPLAAELREHDRRGRVHRVAHAPVDISSTALRRLFARGEVPPGDVVSPMVVDYVRKYTLYR